MDGTSLSQSEDQERDKGQRSAQNVPCPVCAAPIPLKGTARPQALRCETCNDQTRWLFIYNKVNKKK